MLSIRHWPIQERPREKLLNLGAKNLSDAELLAILIRTGTRGKSALDIARELLSRFGNLATLLQADYALLSEQLGFGIQAYTLLQAALALGQRYYEQPLREQSVLANSLQTKQFILAKLRGYKQEIVACLCLDIQHRLICFTELFQGTLDQAAIYPREIVAHALKHNAASLILCHNHPFGRALPSQEDLAVTKSLRMALETVEIKLVDHIIATDNETYSCAEYGHL